MLTKQLILIFVCILLPSEIIAQNWETVDPDRVVEQFKQPESLKVNSLVESKDNSRPLNGISENVASKSLTFEVNGVSFNMILVEHGTFTMGGTPEQGSDADLSEKPAHQVTLTKDYYMGETEVTQALWQAIMGQTPTSDGDHQWNCTYGQGDNRPAYYVSWEDVCGKDGTCTSTSCFLYKLNKLLGDQGMLPEGKKFRLPTEAEWEFAARGGNKSKGYKYSGSNTIDDVAWYAENCWDKGNRSSDYGAHDVATKIPNELGIYDMSGNVWEWCSDLYGKFSSTSQTNPTGPTIGFRRVSLGGSWDNDAKYCRVSFRYGWNAVNCDYNLGLRLVLK